MFYFFMDGMGADGMYGRGRSVQWEKLLPFYLVSMVLFSMGFISFWILVFGQEKKKTFSKAWQLGKTNRYKLVSKHKPFAKWPFRSLLCSIDVGFRRRTQNRLNLNDAECSFKRFPQLFVATHSIFDKWKVHKIQWYYTQKWLLKWFDTDDQSGWLAGWVSLAPNGNKSFYVFSSGYCFIYPI